MAFSVRYIVDDVDEAIEFYRENLGFEVDMHPAPGFAALSRDDLRLLSECTRRGQRGDCRRQPDAGRMEPIPTHGRRPRQHHRGAS